MKVWMQAYRRGCLPLRPLLCVGSGRGAHSRVPACYHFMAQLLEHTANAALPGKTRTFLALHNTCSWTGITSVTINRGLLVLDL